MVNTECVTILRVSDIYIIIISPLLVKTSVSSN